MAPPLLIAILAAGASRRLGQPKQLVAIEGKPLLRRQCEVAIEAGVGSVVVILGCHAEACRAAIEQLSVSIHVNSEWPAGLGSSIACAARTAEAMSAAGLLILHCDQLAIAAGDLNTLYKVWATDRSKAVRSRSGSYIGPPVIFPASAFADLKKLAGDDGAKSVIARLGHGQLVDVNIPSAADDLDTPEQLAGIR